MALKYATTIQLATMLGIKVDIPSWAPGTDSPGNEAVGTGNDVATDFWLDQKNIIDGTYTLYANAVAMTDVTDYALDLITGAIVLTAAGVTLLSTNALTAKYSYIKIDMTNVYLEEVLERAEAKVDNEVNSTFTDGTATNPTYPLQTEIQSSPGFFRDQIISEEKPLIDIETTLDGALDDSQDTVDLAAGTGSNFPSAGSIIVDSEVISYTGITTDQLTSCTRGAMGTTAAAHDDASIVHSTILFLSNTLPGNANVFTVQPWDTQMHASDTGLFYSFSQCTLSASLNADRLVEQDVANRVKLIYYNGYNTIPDDITRLTLIFGKEMLLKDTIGSTLIQGRDEFRPGMMSSDAGEAESIINSYIVIPMGNT